MPIAEVLAEALDRCPICGWRLADEPDHRRVPDPRNIFVEGICEHCAACREVAR